jgi:hypothetical protein
MKAPCRSLGHIPATAGVLKNVASTRDSLSSTKNPAFDSRRRRCHGRWIRYMRLERGAKETTSLAAHVLVSSPFTLKVRIV